MVTLAVVTMTESNETTSSLYRIPPTRPCRPCLCSEREVDCSGLALTSVPSSGLPRLNATTLTLRNNSISFLPSRVFSAWPALQELDLSDNVILNISSGAFEGLSSLKRLNLCCNQLALDDVGDVSEGPFHGLRSLRHLDLSGNHLANVNPAVFRNLNLSWLHLGRNNLTYKNETTWPTKFLFNLKHLDLSHNLVKKVSRGMFHAGLRSLNLNYNQIPLNDEGYPPDAFDALKQSLIHLYMKGNCNTSRPSGDLIYPDKALSRLVKLQVLWLDGIPHQSFGRGFQNLASLKNLSLTGRWGGFCFLNALSNETFRNLSSSLQALDVSLCNISRIEPDAFAMFRRSLRLLDLSYNTALGFDALGDAFYGLQGSVLKRLYVDSIVHPFAMCVILTEHNTRFFRNTSLEVIYARNNRLEVFCKRALGNMPDTLHRVSLYGNNLGFGLYLKDLNNLVGLTEIEVDGHAFARHAPTHFPHEDTEQCQASAYEEPHCGRGWNPLSSHKMYTPPAPDNLEVRMPAPFETNNAALSYVLPPKLTTFTSRWNQLYFRLENITFNSNNSLTALNLQNNLLTTWTGPVRGLRKLEALNLDNNLAFVFSVDFFKEFPALRNLGLSQNYMRSVIKEDINGSLFAALSKLQNLNLSRNYINVLPRQIFRGLVGLTTLNLSRNSIDDFDVNITHMNNLSRIDLSYNIIKYLPQEIMDHLDSIAEHIDVYLDLTFNPLACTCEHLKFLSWLYQSQVRLPRRESYTCLMKDGNYRHNADIFKIVEELHSSCIDKIGILVGAVSCCFCLLVALLSAIAYRYRWKLRYLYYASRLTYSDRDNDFQFDAFVSYSSEDSDFVHRQLVEELETRAGLRLNVHNRDFIPGRPIPGNIVDAVRNSRRTLVVLSRDFVRSDWCHYEMQMATVEAAQRGRDVLVFLIYEDVPSQDMPRDVFYNLQAFTHIQFPAQAEQPLVRDFWNRLVQAIKES